MIWDCRIQPGSRMMKMIICKDISDYITYADQNPRWINKDRKLLIKNIVKPLLKRNDVLFDSETYEKCIRYCESNFYPLFPYQKFVYAMVFIYKKNDMPFFRKFVILEGRGNGKDGFIIPLTNFLQTPLYGVKNYHIEIVANAEKQSKDTFKVAYNMLEDHKKKFKGKFYWNKELIRGEITGSEMNFNTSESSTKDGKKIGCLIFNELHAYEDYEQINVFESALGKIKHPREFIITTQGYVRDGPLDDILTACAEILETGENELEYFPFLCRLDSIKEMEDPDLWHKANPSLEYMPILEDEIKKEYLEMQKFPSKKPEFITKRMNLPSRKEEETVTSWENILRCCYTNTELKTPRPIPDTAGKRAVIGIDYADVRDFASAGILTKSENDYIWVQHTWICSESPFLDSIKFPLKNFGQSEFQDFEIVEAPTIPVEDIIKWCETKMEVYTVAKITMDTYRYTLFKTLFEQHGISIESKDNPRGTVRLIRKLGSATGIIAPFIEQCFSEGTIIYGPSSIMRWYTNNTCIITDKFGNKQYGKIEPKLRKNDGFMAFDAAMFSKDELEEKIIYI